ncbi:MAG: helix-turn-helix domain-containing protein [Chloroflexota bacterium]
MTETKGILNPKNVETKFQLTRYFPAPDLAFFVMRYWIIRWDLDEPHVQETLPYPCVNLAFEKNKTLVYGVERGKAQNRIEGKGQVFGVKFRPGAFYPFIKIPMTQLTDRTLPVGEIFGIDDKALEDAVLSLDDDEAMIALVESFLRDHLPERDENITLINQIVDCIVDDRRIIKVDDIVALMGIQKRTLERLFSQYVGVSPKWVIQRYRLHEAAEQLAADPVGDCSQMALALGYFDQAHFIKDFKAVIGTTPAEYARKA